MHTRNVLKHALACRSQCRHARLGLILPSQSTFLTPLVARWHEVVVVHSVISPLCALDSPALSGALKPSRLLMQGLKGRLISSRYTVLHTAIHAGTLFAIVCPDGSTAASQKPCALRVYSLDISSQAGTWQLCSPCAQDGVACKYPLPRNQPACTDVGGKVRSQVSCEVLPFQQPCWQRLFFIGGWSLYEWMQHCIGVET
jgi:hypothetical protein